MQKTPLQSGINLVKKKLLIPDRNDRSCERKLAILNQLTPVERDRVP
jgi:hypothetical protein